MLTINCSFIPNLRSNFRKQQTWIPSRRGGGGGGRHGIKNKITGFDFSSRAPKIESSAELEVSEDDSVTCLANLATKDGLILYAGNGSNVDDRLKGQDMHFRSFELQFPKSKTASSTDEGSGQISFMSKTMLFTPPKAESARKEAYQRLIRLSPPQRNTSGILNKRIGAIATGLAGDENELVIFSATSNRPQAQDIIQRIALPKGQEANDVDIFDQGEGLFQVAYVMDQEVYIQDVDYDFIKSKSRTSKERRKLYTVPHPDGGEKSGRSKLRSVRWLSPKHLLFLLNKPNRTGAELVVLHLYEEGPGSIIIRKTLPRHVAAATDMDVALLDSDSNGAYQVAIAVGGIDISLSVFTIDYNGPAHDSLSRFHKYATYDSVHDVQMTKVIFSPFNKPDVASGKAAGPQYIRLASTSLGNTISVETFELQPHKSRHVLQTARTRTLHSAASYLVVAMIVAAIALMAQSFVDPQGHLTRGLIPSRFQNIAGKTFGEAHLSKRRAANLNNVDTPAAKVERRIRDLLHLHNPPVDSSSIQTKKALVVHHDPETGGELSTEIHDDHEAMLEKHTEAKRWDELSKEEQLLWKKKLTDAGMWAVGEGETILKSIFFGQLGGLVGQVAHGVIG
ncbi:hypothetical protein GQ44DRAFT_697785 [Phaeosphaeriaceae sp. PMI808]|nr:hypothetical protein GQ44DRAFT_697785 [Phaeosphaeriaceae sp. PMI808]